MKNYKKLGRPLSDNKKLRITLRMSPWLIQKMRELRVNQSDLAEKSIIEKTGWSNETN